jgi:hypothetical protein
VIVGAGAVVLAAGIGLWWVTSRALQPAEPAVTHPPDPAPPRAEPPKPQPSAPPPTAPPTAEKPAAPKTGTLLIKSDVPDTSVFIDRRYLGTAPVTATDLTPGTHHLNMSATGYDGISEDIEVVAGTRELSRSFKTITLDAKLDVVHKHGIGSCKGTLRATPQGLTYETDHKEDGFTVALTDLESFQMDYLKKVMTLKIRKGRSYTFTDPDDNVNRLYTFHQEVDKVRKKLGGT